MKKTNKLCYHVGLPEHDQDPGHIWECDCGGNSYCDVCGYGRAMAPCNCEHVQKIVSAAHRML